MNGKRQLLDHGRSRRDDVNRQAKKKDLCSRDNIGDRKLQVRNLRDVLSTIPRMGEAGNRKLPLKFINTVMAAHERFEISSERRNCEQGSVHGN